mgnify:FL=1
MKDIDYNKIREEMKESLDNKRYEHTLGVAYTAACLAMRYDYNVQDAMIAGLLHDCAKCLSDKKRLSICEKNNISVSKTEEKNPSLLHAKVGAYLAAEKYAVDNEEILNAIRFHTTGKPAMNLLEKIIYIADYIEPNRKQAPNLEIVRKLAFEDIDTALIKILSDTLEYLTECNEDMDPLTQETYEYYINLV